MVQQPLQRWVSGVTVHVLVEGPSERALMESWLPRVLPLTFRVHPHQGKGTLPTSPSAKPDPRHRGLLDQLPAKLRGFAGAPEPVSVIVLVDADDDSIENLRSAITNIVSESAPNLRVIVRIAVEETEAFYLGDLKALKAAFPRADMNRARRFVPDSICGTWEKFAEIIQDQGGNKVAWARAIGPVLTTRAAETRSPSCKLFLEGVASLSSSESATMHRRQRRPYRHPPRNRSESGRRRRKA